MTKADLTELNSRLDALDYWLGLTYRNAINLKVMTKRQVLEELRGREQHA